MSGLFSQAQIDQINAVAAKSRAELKPVKSSGSISSKQKAIDAASREVLEYFKDSPAILITTREELHDYVLKAIEAGYCGIDTETTGLDKVHDTIVGFSLYYPGGVECYIPSKHRTLVETYYKNQLSYEDIGAELQLFVEAKTKMIFANADFDLAMIYKDFHVDMIDICFYDCILAWRCLKEDEPKNDLKTLYWKYPNQGKGSPKKFSDFFDPKLFPYSQPDVAKLYAANDAKITYLLFAWQLPFITKSHSKCQKHHLEKIADLIWNIEFPMIRVCALMHRYGLFLDLDTSNALKNRYHNKLDTAGTSLSEMVQEIIDQSDAITISKSPFKSGKDFNNSSNPQTLYLFNKFLGMDLKSCDKETLSEMNHPIAKQILKVRSADKLIGTFIDKMPEVTGGDGRVHSTFKSVGADSGRMSSVAPNVQNIPSHATDIRHQFRATPAMLKVDKCDRKDNTVSIALGNWDTVWRDDKSPALVNELKVGDKVSLLNHNIECVGSVTAIDDKAPVSIVWFNVLGLEPTNCRIKHKSPPYVIMSSDFSQQEPKLVAFITQDPNMLDAFMHDRDIYATIAALSFNSTYEECLEFNPITGENQPEGKERRSQAKKIVLGILYGRSVKSIGEQLFGGRTDMTEDDMTKEAQKIYDAVLNAFPNLRAFMDFAQQYARDHGYVETILGRRRHIPDMQLPMYEFHATKKYVNPDIDPLDVKTLKNKNEIPTRVIKQLQKEFANYKYMGQVYRRIKDLDENEHIKVVVNKKKIQDASRKCVNSIVQGCLSGDVRIQTKEFGIVKLQDYVGSTLTVWDGDAWSSGTITYSGKKQKCILTFTNGQSIVCSPTHKFLTINTRGNKHFKQLNQLKLGDRIVLNPNFTDSDYVYSSVWSAINLSAHNAKYCSLDMVEDKFALGVFLGRLASDGSYQMRDNGGCCLRQLIAEHELNILPTLETVSDIWGGHTTIKDVRPNRNQRMAQIDVTSKSLVNEISKLDIKHSLHDNIFMDTRLLRGFLSGFYDGDGCISAGKSIQLVFGTQYDFKPLINDLQKALSFLGISSYQHQYKDRSVLTVRMYDAHKFCKLVGFVNSDKQMKATQVSTKKDNHTFGCSFAIVKDINITEEQIDMYDVCNTTNGYFIADGLVTHNSAADLTKIAILKVFNNAEWKALGGRVLLPVHDELIAEIPIYNWKRGGELLSSLMSEAGSFLPFPINCDVTTTLRWYGLSYPCIYTKPEPTDVIDETLAPEKISWIQYHLFELEYLLPTFPNPDGSKLEGDAAVGVNGIWSQELADHIQDYMSRYGITLDEFVDHIDEKVVYDTQL